MPYLKAKMHHIQFWLGFCPRSCSYHTPRPLDLRGPTTKGREGEKGEKKRKERKKEKGKDQTSPPRTKLLATTLCVHQKPLAEGTLAEEQPTNVA